MFGCQPSTHISDTYFTNPTLSNVTSTPYDWITHWNKWKDMKSQKVKQTLHIYNECSLLNRQPLIRKLNSKRV